LRSVAEARREAPTEPEPTPKGSPVMEPMGGMPLWLRGVLPLVLLAGLVVVFLRFGPVGVFQAAFPPVEQLTIERVSFPAEGALRVRLVNGGPEPVTVAQVTVDDAFWDFEMGPERIVPRLRSATIDVPYPWVEGEPLAIGVLTSTGLLFTHEVAVSTLSPRVGARYLSTFALLGIYVGVIPVFLGLLWLPFLSGIGERWVHFFLAFTVGLLVFLGVDALSEAVDLAGSVAPAFQGIGLVTLGALGAPLLIEAVGRSRRGRGGGSAAYRTAALIALGIGLHNLGEGLAIGASYAVGEIALGSMLVLGFLLHNATEGLGIVAPLAKERPRLSQLVLLGTLAGVPTVLGAWIGGFTYSPTAAVLFLAIGAGAVAQVVWTLFRFMSRKPGGGFAEPLNAAGLVAGLAVMWTTGLLVAL
jgi:zinc transporter, ZIP family